MRTERLRRPTTLMEVMLALVALACVLVVLLEASGPSPAATSSGANGDIAYARSGSIYLVSTGSVVQASGVEPSWSPDGTKLAFVDGGVIKTCTVTGGACTAVVSTGVTGNEPEWSPDGTKLAYVTPSSQIHTMTPAGASDTTVTSGNIDTSPSWSPDGSKLVFTRNGSIATVSSSGGSVTALTTTGVSGSSHPDWAPDDSGIVFQSGTPSQIYIVSSDGGTAEAITSTSETLVTPTWSPDARSIAFAQTSGTPGIYKVVEGTGGIFGAPEPVHTAAGDSTPAWQTAAPIAVSPPSIVGGLSPVTGSNLATTSGSWQGASNSGFTYQWLRCNAAGSSCANIGGATSSTYAPVGGDVGSTLRTVVTASNTAGSTVSAQSTQTGIVTLAGSVTPPTNSVLPVVSLPSGQTTPAPQVGTTLTVSLGTWGGTFPLTYTYQWKMCEPEDPVNSPCFTIPGATSAAFTVPGNLFGKRLRAEVTARNAGGSASANSAATATVTATPPTLTATPQIRGINMVGEELELTEGAWTGSAPITYTYEWRRCEPAGTPSSCVPIPGAVADSYTPVAADIGSALRVWVTGTNPAGSAVAITIHTFPIVDEPHSAPGPEQVPTVTGTAIAGGTLTATMGIFTGDQPITTKLQWQRCDAVGITCRVASRASRLSFALTDADVGSTFRVVVTATNAYGTTEVASELSDPVLGMPNRSPGKEITGTATLTFLLGTAFDDTIVAGPGNVTIDGAGGYDTIRTGIGRTVVTVRGPGSSTVTLGKGSSTVYAANGYPDTVTCTGTRDRVYADGLDKVTGCATVTLVAQTVRRG